MALRQVEPPGYPLRAEQVYYSAPPPWNLTISRFGDTSADA
jgi:hypothetical protein